MPIQMPQQRDLPQTPPRQDDLPKHPRQQLDGDLFTRDGIFCRDDQTVRPLTERTEGGPAGGEVERMFEEEMGLVPSVFFPSVRQRGGKEEVNQKERNRKGGNNQVNPPTRLFPPNVSQRKRTDRLAKAFSLRGCSSPNPKPIPNSSSKVPGLTPPLPALKAAAALAILLAPAVVRG
jgi:hypothetical protein